MEIIACANCGKLFNFIRGQKVCQTCMKELEDKFAEVKKYVRDHPNVDIRQLSKEMEVSVAQINRWVREERLVFSDESPLGIPCESCGITIKTGRYCNTCKTKMTNDFRDAAGLNKKREPVARKREATSNKMRFLDN